MGFLLQACEAIAEAHALGIVHRDLKPANMFLTQRRDGSPLVSSARILGISKALQETSGGVSVTSTTAVMGSPLYMSPEQVRSSKTVDARSAVWALGVILQELLTGAPTYEAETASALMAMIAADPPTLLRVRRPDAPVQLELAILRCLEKDRDRRMSPMSPTSRFARSRRLRLPRRAAPSNASHAFWARACTLFRARLLRSPRRRRRSGKAARPPARGVRLNRVRALALARSLLSRLCWS